MTAKTPPKARAFMLTKTADLVDFATLKALCQTLPSDYKWALMTHDLDEGSNHYHVAVQTPYPMTPNAIAKKMHVAPNFVTIWRRNVANMWAYLPHNTTVAHDEKADYNHYLTDPTKFATNHTDLTAFEFSKEKKAGKTTKLNDTIKKILLGDVTKKDLLKPENIVYYHENAHKLDRAIKLRTESLRYNPPKCQTVYIQGASGTGKSSHGVKLAKERYGENYAFASAGNDPLQDYTGEKCLIFDDWRPKDFEFNELLALLDPHHRQRTHKSRYYNKPLATELIIITSNTTLESATAYYTDYTNEDPKQLRRRVHELHTCSADMGIQIETYNEQLDGYEIETPKLA